MVFVMKKFVRITVALSLSAILASTFAGCAFLEPSAATEYQDYVVYGGEATGVASLNPHLAEIYDEANEALKEIETQGNILGVFTSITLDSTGSHWSRETTPESLGQWDANTNIYFASEEESRKAVDTLADFYVSKGYEVRGAANAVDNSAIISLVRLGDANSSANDLISITSTPKSVTNSKKMVFDISVRTVTDKMPYSQLPILAGKLTEKDINKIWGDVRMSQSSDSCSFTTQDNVVFNSPWGGWLDAYDCVETDASLQSSPNSTVATPVTD